MQDKATRASWRAVTVAAVPPMIAAGVTYWLWRTGKPVEEIGAGAAATGVLIMVGSPFVLWWSVSAPRRGTRRMVLSLLTGFYSGTLMVLLVAGVIAVAAGYTLLTGNAVPYVGWRLEIPGGIR
jgi:cytochrome c oxidase assembly factor CtaG